jgi:hypothetical protein
MRIISSGSIEGRPTQTSQHLRYNWVDPAQEMPGWNPLFEVEKIEKLALINRLLTHHDPLPS